MEKKKFLLIKLIYKMKNWIKKVNSVKLEEFGIKESTTLMNPFNALNRKLY